MADLINNPKHYTVGGIETIAFIEGKGLGYHEGNIVKYVTRWRHKNGIQDLEKARWYINRLIEQNTPPKQWEWVPPTDEQQDAYLDSLKTLRLDKQTPYTPEWNPKACSICGDAYFCDGPESHNTEKDDAEWAPEECARPFGIDGNIFPGEGKVITNVHELIEFLDARQGERAPAEDWQWTYPTSWPYTPKGPCLNPCGKGHCAHDAKED